MLTYTIKRLFQLIPILFVISVVAYAIIELPPGDFADFYISSLRATGVTVLEDEALRKVLQFYDKPDFWYIYVGSLEMQEQYYIPGADDFRPGRPMATLPHDKELEDRMSYWVLGTNAAAEASKNTLTM